MSEFNSTKKKSKTEKRFCLKSINVKLTLKIFKNEIKSKILIQNKYKPEWTSKTKICQFENSFSVYQNIRCFHVSV